MEVLDELGSNEKLLSIMAAEKRVPYAGTFELLPLCNMNCKMCYIRTTPEEMKKQGQLLTADEWIEIAEQAIEEGLLYLLLTGGEPLLYPEFKKLYTWLCQHGIIVMLNSNGTLMDEDIADFLSEMPPRKVNISLYGANRNTYEKVCGYAHGFDKAINGIRLLKERDIPVKVNCSLTPYNKGDLAELHRLCRELDVPLQVTPYMFPPIRKNGVDTEIFRRFSPEEAGPFMALNARIAAHSEQEYFAWAKKQLDKLRAYKDDEMRFRMKENGFACYAAKNNFWINWKGEMLPCGMMNGPAVSALTRSFAECWKKTVEAASKIKNPSKCVRCEKRVLCTICSAGSVSETGDFDQVPEYVCRMTDAFINELRLVVNDYEIE